MKKYLPLIILFLLTIPTFSLMVRYGIFSMQDFHYFRLLEFDKCVKALQIPCRWAPDSGAGYGEPLFNFYGQLPYAIGEIFHLLTLSKIDSLKIVFILSLSGSAFTMFLLARKIWGNNLSAVLSSIIYLYAPYRAVDVWVRGALPEAVSFIFFPLIILFVENYLSERKKRDLLLFSLTVSFLVLNHNLSVILFAPFLIIWFVFRFIQTKDLKPFVFLGVAGAFSFLISAFYILPVVFESKFVDINSTTVGYFDWRAHFVTIKQLFISRFWGYGGSTWGDQDGLSLSVGQLQWIVPLITGAIVLVKRKVNKDNLNFVVFLIIGAFSLFLTHNKSTIIWNTLPFMKYIQFPWRFLGVAVFSLSLASGLVVKELKKHALLVGALIIFLTISFNFNFFRPDIWYSVSDRDLETGQRWDESRFASIGDYWPNFGHKIPDKISDGSSINYFPGWNYQPDKNGLIPSRGAVFSNTPVRTIGNYLSLIGIGVWLVFFVKFRNRKV